MKHTKKTVLIALLLTASSVMTACTNSDAQKDADSTGSKTQAVETNTTDAYGRPQGGVGTIGY